MKQATGRSIPGFRIAAGLLIAFVLLPLAAILLTTSPRGLAKTLNDPEVGLSLGATFLAAGWATALGLAGGVPLAYLLARKKFRGRWLVDSLINLPVVIPHTAAGIALLLVFGQSGWLGAPLAKIGVFFIDRLAGTVMAMLFVSVPYLVNITRDTFALIDPDLEKMAQLDGATAWQSFWRITFPMAGRGILGGALMMWSRGISEFGAVVILAYYPKIAPTLIFERFQGFGLTAAQPAAAILIVAALVIFILLRWLLLPRIE